jgi:peptidoglycan/xylan/chitin deacetylase (PgdA/CDA1 family)
VHLDRTFTLLYAGLAGRAAAREARDRVPVLMYHSVSEVSEAGVQPYYRLSISPARFRDQMQMLADRGCAVTSLEPIADETGAARAGGPRAVVTFDDGYLDFLDHAWPVLERHGFTASVFLPTSFIGESTRLQFKGRECLMWPEVRDLARRGVSFGSHTVTHAVLHQLPWPEVRTELRDSRESLERALGTPVSTFAYPYAFPQHDRAFVARFRGELREQGYRACVTTVIGRHAPGDDPLRVKRLPVNEADDLRLFSAKLAGAYDWVGAIQSAWKRVR